MTGIVGNTGCGGTLSASGASMLREDWYEFDRFEAPGGQLGLVHHGSKDPNGWSVWDGPDGVVVVHGVVANRERLGLDADELFERLLNRPSDVLPRLSGPFALACLKRDGTVTLATDKLGTRSLYFADTDRGLTFGSEIKPLLSHVDAPELNPDAVGDLVSFGYVLGDKTLLRGVSALRAATMATYRDGELDVTRYWKPQFGRLPEDGYVERAMDAYRRSMADVSGTLDGRVGLFLSGGLDSRLMASVLRDEYGPVRSITYDSNPADGSNVEPARTVADALDFENRLVELKPGDYPADIESVVDITDGMISWSYLLSLDYILHDIRDDVDVVMEGATQGELFGEQLWTHHLTECSDATEALLRSFPHLGTERVNELVTAPVDPEQSIAREVGESDETEQAHRALDTWLRTFTANSHFRNKKVLRSQVGVRIPFATDELLNTVAKMPHERYRRDVLPFTRGRIPRSMAPLKRDLVAALDDTLANVPYERTRVGAGRPMWLHDATYVGKQLYWEFVTGRPNANLGDWSREDEATRRALRSWLDRAADRKIFDRDAVETLAEEHFSGAENHLTTISPITGVELWLEKYLD